MFQYTGGVLNRLLDQQRALSSNSKPYLTQWEALRSRPVSVTTSALLCYVWSFAGMHCAVCSSFMISGKLRSLLVQRPHQINTLLTVFPAWKIDMLIWMSRSVCELLQTNNNKDQLARFPDIPDKGNVLKSSHTQLKRLFQT